MIPEWLNERLPIEPSPDCTLVGPSKKNIIDLTLGAFTGFFRESTYAEGYSGRTGLLQLVDPRFKLVGTIILVTCIAFMTRLEWILGFHLLIFLLVVASRVRLSYFLKRTWLFIPLFTLVVVTPSMFSFFSPGKPLLTLLALGQQIGSFSSPWTIAFTVQGVSAAVLFILRTGAAVSLVVLLTLTTRWTDLLASLQNLKVPKAFVMVLGMTYRYVFVLVGIAQDMYYALKSRTLIPMESGQTRRWIGRTIGVLLHRSFSLSEDVHLAMISRGYDGNVRRLNRFHAQVFDWFFLVFLLTLAALLLTLRNVVVM